MARIIIASDFGAPLEVEQSAYDAGFFPGYIFVGPAPGGAPIQFDPYMDAAAAAAAQYGTQLPAALRATFGLGATATDTAVAAFMTTSGTQTQAGVLGLFQTLGKSNGTNDSAWINAAIAGGGAFRGRPGETYLIGNPGLQHPSNVDLDFSGCTIQDITGLTTDMVRSANDVTPAATGTATTTVGSAVVTTALTATVGQTVVVNGARDAGSPLVGNVTAVGSGTLTLSRTATVAVTGAAARVYTRHANVSIRGGHWQRTASTGTGYQVFNLRHIDGLTVDPDTITSTQGLYALWVGDVTDYRLGIGQANTVRDAIHINGPATRGKILRINGKTGDDSVGVTGANYAAQNDVAGDVLDLDLGPILTDSSYSNLKLVPGAGFLLSGVVASHVGGTCVQAGVFIGEDNFDARCMGGTIGTVDTGLVTSLPSDSSWRQVALMNPTADLIRTKVRRPGTAQTESVGTFFMSGGATPTSGTVIKRLEIDADVTGPWGIFYGGVAQNTINSLSISGRYDQQSGTRKVVFVEFGAVLDLELPLAAHLTSGGVLVSPGNGASGYIARMRHSGYLAGQSGLYNGQYGNTQPIVITLAGRIVGGNFVVYATGTTTVILAGATLDGQAQQLFQVDTGTLTAVGQANIVNAASSTFRRVATETLRVNGTGLKVDVATLTPVDGDLAFNTNSGLGCGVGPAAYNAAAGKWKGLYSGATN